MSSAPSNLVRRLLLLSPLLLAGACARVPGHQGFILDRGLVAAVKPGVDNKASVQAVLGRPSFAGQFSDTDWYYVSRETRQFAYREPRASNQTIVRVRFDPAGNVARVDQIGMERVAALTPSRDKTETLGRRRSLLDEIFGGIGRVGGVGGTGGGTADNPNGD